MQTGEPLGLLLILTACGASSDRIAGQPLGLLLAITQSQPVYRGLATLPKRENYEVDDE